MEVAILIRKSTIFIVLYMAVLSFNTVADLVECLRVGKHLPVWMCVGVCLALVKDMA